MQVRCCGNCKNGHFGKCMNSKCVGDRYSNFIPADPHIEEMMKKELRDKEETINHFIHAVEWFRNGC